MFRQRLAVERVREQRLVAERFVARQTASERLIELDLLLAKVGFFFAMIGAEEHDLVSVGFEPCGLQHLLQRNTRPSTVAREPLNASASVSRAFERRDELVAAHRLDLVER